MSTISTMISINSQKTILALAFAVISSPVLASTSAGNISAGKQKAAICASCHGADGNKTANGTYPMLAGQYPDYLAKALHDYKSGKRKNVIMGGQAQNLSDKDIADLAAYFGSLKGQLRDLSSTATKK